MKKTFSLLLIFLGICSTTYSQKNIYAGQNCVIEKHKKKSSHFLLLFEKISGCQENTKETLDKHCYCEPSCFNIYELSPPSYKEPNKIYLFEILKGNGREGKEYWIVRKADSEWKTINYFTGDLLCIKQNKYTSADIFLNLKPITETLQ